MILLELRLPGIASREKTRQLIDVFKQAGIGIDTGSAQRLKEVHGVWRAAFDGDRLPDHRIRLVGLVHAPADQDGFPHARRRLHKFPG
jgi:hypothetical protein